MKKILTCFLIFYTYLGSTAQIHKANKTKNNKAGIKAGAVDRFDTRRFNRSKKDRTYEFYLSDSTYVRQYETSDTYCEEITLPDKLTVRRKCYYKKTSLLKAESVSFSGCYIGINRQYDAKSNLTKERDFDSVFTFSLEDLDTKMSGLGIDIRNYNNRISVHRSEDPSPYYQVFCPVDKSLLYHNIYIIDGITGVIKSISKCYTPRCGNDERKIPCETLFVEKSIQ